MNKSFWLYGLVKGKTNEAYHLPHCKKEHKGHHALLFVKFDVYYTKNDDIFICAFSIDITLGKLNLSELCTIMLDCGCSSTEYSLIKEGNHGPADIVHFIFFQKNHIFHHSHENELWA